MNRPVSERRRVPRKRILKGGTIAYGGRCMTVGCVVRDLSGTGARLQVKQPLAVPDTFELMIDLDGIEVVCEVMRRASNEIGVRFITDVGRVAPKRMQVVEMSMQPSLRRTVPRRDPAPAAAGAEPSIEAETGVADAIAPSVVRRAEIPVVIAEDDPDDRLMLESVFRETAFAHPYQFVEDGEQLLRYLRRQHPYEACQPPGLVLLDLNMPRMDGRTALMNMKTDSALRRLPVIVLTTSDAEDDIDRTYELGVSAYIQKPNSQDGLVSLASAIDQYWMNMVRLPRSPGVLRSV